MSTSVDSIDVLLQQPHGEQPDAEEKKRKEMDTPTPQQSNDPVGEVDAHEVEAEEIAEDELVEKRGSKRLQILVGVVGALALCGFLYFTWINAPWMEKRPRKNEIVVRDPKGTTPMPDDTNDVRHVLDQLRAQGAPRTQATPANTTSGSGVEAQANPTEQSGPVSSPPAASKSTASLPTVPAAYWASSFGNDTTATSLRNGSGDAYSAKPTASNSGPETTSSIQGERGETREENARNTTVVHGTGEQTRSIRISTEGSSTRNRQATPNMTPPTQTREISENKLPFGTQLPVRLVGQISSLNSSIPIRLELVDDFQAGSLRLSKGTKFIAEITNAFAGRIQARVVGFIRHNQNGEENFVPIEGQLLGSDAAPGLIGVERTIRTNKRSALTNALSRVGQAGLNVARGALYGLGVGGQVGAQAIESVATPELYVYQDSSGYFRYVEVPAGVFGYVLVTAIPQPTAP